MDHPLLQFCLSDNQRLLVEEHIVKGRALSAVAREKNISERGLRKTKAALLGRAGKHGYSPDHDWTHPVPDGHKIKGVSTYYNEDGKPTAQWVKSQTDAEAQERMMREAISSMMEEIKPLKKTKAPTIKENDLLNCYVLTDYHIGMLAWGEETGADWDIDIAEKTLVSWFSHAIEKSPKASHAVFAQLGDMMHFDSYTPVTVASGHILDADSRLQKIIRCVIRVIRQIMSMLLEKYKHVHVKWCDANHDPTSAAWMREFLTALYSNEPRVSIDNSADTYYCYEWGKTALFFHHGHKRKVANVDTVFAAKFRDVFGRTEHNYAHMGHYHSIDKKETNLMVVEQHRTLAAPDAYSSKGGWISGREANVITYHKEYGQVGCNTISYKMVSS